MVTAPIGRSPGRLEAGDAIRVLATAAVVLQHVGHATFHHPDSATRGEWAFAALVVGATKWAVPVFVLLSGALLLESRPGESLRGFYRRRFTRVGIPLVFWSAFYLATKAVFSTESSEQLWTRLVSGRPYYHMFFMYVIAGLYLFTPMLRRFTGGAGPGEVPLAVGLMLGLAAVNALIGSSQTNAFTLFLPYSGYFLAGWWIRRTGAGPTPRWAWPVFLAAMAVLIGVSIALHDPKGTVTSYLHGYQSLPLIAMSLSVFVIALEPGWLGAPDGAMARACSSLSPLTLGIYLIHPAVLKAMSKAGIDGLIGHTEIAIPLLSAAAFAISAAVTAAMRRYRPLALLVGG